MHTHPENRIICPPLSDVSAALCLWPRSENHIYDGMLFSLRKEGTVTMGMNRENTRFSEMNQTQGNCGYHTEMRIYVYFKKIYKSVYRSIILNHVK